MIYPKLPKAFKRKWIAALRSGKYKKGRDVLLSSSNNGNKYCCLGVAAVIVGCNHIEQQTTIERKSGITGISKVPNVLIGSQSDNDLVDTLVTKNDSLKWSFKRIANWIEKNV